MDYTKCNFDPIIGADVAIATISDEKRKEIYGKFLFREAWRTPWAEEDNLVLCCSDDYIGCSVMKVKIGDVRCIKATMKPRDMNYERLERAIVEVGLKCLKEHYNGLEPLAFDFKNGALAGVSAKNRGEENMPFKSIVRLKADTPYDITHWLKENEK